MHTLPFRRLIIAIATAACGFLVPSATVAEEIKPTFKLDCTLRAPHRARVGNPVLLTFDLRNRGSKALNVLMRNTPFEGFLGQYLTIIGPHGTLNYGGAMVKRGAPSADEYLRIRPHTKRTRTINIAEVYAFDTPGQYRIQFTGGLHDVTLQKGASLPDQLAPQALNCAEIVIEMMPGKA